MVGQNIAPCQRPIWRYLRSLQIGVGVRSDWARQRSLQVKFVHLAMVVVHDTVAVIVIDVFLLEWNLLERDALTIAHVTVVLRIGIWIAREDVVEAPVL